jgi:hypothetical protein
LWEPLNLFNGSHNGFNYRLLPAGSSVSRLKFGWLVIP